MNPIINMKICEVTGDNEKTGDSKIQLIHHSFEHNLFNHNNEFFC